MAEINIAQPMRFRVDVKTGLVEQPQRGGLMKGDRKANRIIVELVNGSENVDITGVKVKGRFMRPPDMDEIELKGTAEGNLAIVQLEDTCYTAGGHYEATVSLVLDDVERTVLFISGEVYRSGSGNAAGDEDTGDEGGSTGGGGSSGSGLPSGGTAGQVLVKASSAEGAAIWKTLTAADVKARADDWMPTAEETGALPKDGTAVNATKLNGKDADKYALKTDTAPDSDKLGGVAASQYAKKTDIPKDSGVDLLTAYPVGSIYISVIETSPAAIFGGTWEQIPDRFLLGAGGSYALGNTGGEAEVTLTLNQTPKHDHAIPGEPHNDLPAWEAPNQYVTYGYRSGTVTSVINTNKAGGGAAHNNMPPWEAVNIWKRVE